MMMISKSISFNSAKSEKFLETVGSAHTNIHIFNVNKYNYELSKENLNNILLLMCLNVFQCLTDLLQPSKSNKSFLLLFPTLSRKKKGYF